MEDYSAKNKLHVSKIYILKGNKQFLSLIICLTLFSILGTCIYIGLSFLKSKNQQRIPEIAILENPICSQISITLSPQKETYQPGEQVTVNINGITDPLINSVGLMYASTSSDTSLGGAVWKGIPLSKISGDTYQALWSIPKSLLTPNYSTITDPALQANFHIANFQEYFLSVNLMKNEQWLCHGNPDAGNLDQYYSQTANKVVIAYKPPSQPLDLSTYYGKFSPGNSWTFTGKRYDNPQKCLQWNGDTCVSMTNALGTNPNLVNRIEIEAPIKICGNQLLPMRFTKNNPWAYWMPATKIPVMNWWWTGMINLRFFITDPTSSYRWNSNFIGTYGDKKYDTPNNSLDDLGTLSRSYRYSSSTRTSTGFENYYYPPYLLMPRYIDKTGSTIFNRTDSVIPFGNSSQTTIQLTEQSSFCQPSPSEKNGTHGWSSVAMVLTDPTTLAQFNPLRKYFPSNEVVLIQFYEFNTAKGPDFREDWYLMEGVGLVGIDQLFPDNSISPNFDFTKAMTIADNQLTISTRLRSAYLGEPLDITISPSVVTAGSSYTLTAVSHNSRLPYDGKLEYYVNDTTGRLWGSNNKGYWVDNGSVIVPTDGFGPGYYSARFRPIIDTSPESQTAEERVAPPQLPWSNPVGVTITNDTVSTPTPTPTPTTAPTPTSTPSPYDFNGSGRVDIEDFSIFLTHFGLKDMSKVDYNQDQTVNILDYSYFKAAFHSDNGS